MNQCNFHLSCCVQGSLGKNKNTQKDISDYSLKCKEKATSDNNKAQCQRKDTALSGQDDPSIAEEPVLPREHFPFPPRPLRSLLGVLVLRGAGRHRQRPRVDLLVLAVLHHVNSIDTVPEVAKGTHEALLCRRDSPSGVTHCTLG